MNGNDNRSEWEAKLDQRLSRLPDELEPKSDLWPAISQRISAPVPLVERESKRRVWFRTAALAASLAVVSSLATSWWLSRAPDSVDVVQSPTSKLVFRDVVHAPAFGIQQAGIAQVPGETYIRDRKVVIAALREQMQLLPEDTRHKVERDLLMIDRALEDISQELTGDPNNVLLQQLLLAMYQEELMLLEGLNQTTEAVKAQRTNL